MNPEETKTGFALKLLWRFKVVRCRMYWLNWWTFSSTHFLLAGSAEAAPVISSQLVPDES